MNTLRTGQAEVRGSNESGQLDSSGESSEGEETDDDYHRRTGRGGEGGCSPPQILGNSDFLGSKRKFGQSQLLKTFHVFL